MDDIKKTGEDKHGDYEHQWEKLAERKLLLSRVIKTGCLVITWICIGLFTEMTGPTFKDLELRMHLPPKEATEAVSRAISGRSAGFFAGAVIGGFIVDRFKGKGDLFIAVSLCGAAGATIVIPWMSAIVTMWLLTFIQGTFEGIINIAGQELILMLWGEKSAAPLHLLHFGFGIGSFLNPLIAQPFLAVKQTNVTDVNVTTNTTGNFTSGDLNSTTFSYVGSQIEYAYLIVAVISTGFSLTFFWYYFQGVLPGTYVCPVRERMSSPGTYVQSSKLEERPVPGWREYLRMLDPATCADGKRLAGFSIFVLLFFYFFQAVGGERIYSKFIRNFALDQLNFSSSDASFLNSTFWISFAIGRFLGFVVAIWVPIRILIVVECFAGLGFSILFNIFGYSNSLALWVITQPMGIFIAPLFPSGVGWGDHYLTMSGLGLTILMGGGSLGGVIYMWIMGHVYPTYGPRSFLYMMLGYSIAACVLVSVMSVAGFCHGDRFMKAESGAEDKNETELSCSGGCNNVVIASKEEPTKCDTNYKQ